MADSDDTGEFEYGEDYDGGTEDYGGDPSWAAGPSDDGAMFAQPVTVKPEVLAPSDVFEAVDALVDEVVAVMQWSRTSALLVLWHSKWSPNMVKERYFEDPEGFSAQCGVENFDDSFNQSTAEEDCGVCWDSCPAGDTASLACGHWQCRACWASHLQFHLRNSGTNSIAVPCPHKGCVQRCGRSAFETVFGASSVEVAKYKEFLARAFMEHNSHYRACAAANCDKVCRYPISRTAISEPSAGVKCTCGFQYCFLCGLEDHGPADCKTMQLWKKKEGDESENANWVAAHTKPCPGKGCGRTIEKSGGCNHMTCPHCKHEWCWVCEGPWKIHGSEYYKCNHFKDTEASKARAANRDDARTELERYIHYYTRYQNHGRSRKLDASMLAATRRRISRELSESNQSLIDLDYLETTAIVLTKCRHVLMYTYVYAFYLQDAKAKELFEYNQSQLEFFTEQLSEFVEDTSGRFTKQDVVNRTSTADRMLQKLQEGCIQLSH